MNLNHVISILTKLRKDNPDLGDKPVAVYNKDGIPKVVSEITTKDLKVRVLFAVYETFIVIE